MPAIHKTKSSSVTPYPNHAGPSQLLPKPDNQSSHDQKWGYITQATSPEEFQHRALELDAHTAAKNHRGLQNFINYKFKPTTEKITSKYAADAFPGTTAEMKQWVEVEQEFPKGGKRPKALILWGPNRTGKTE